VIEPTISTFSVTKGGRVESTYAVFQDWDLDASVDENLARMRETNPILAPTEAWLKEMRRIFRVRFGDIKEHEPLIRLAQSGMRLDSWPPLLLWHLCYRELLLSDFLETWLYPRKQEGLLRVRSDDVRDYLDGLRERGLLDKDWTESTLKRMASGLPSYAADFGLLEGATVKEIAPFHLPEPALLYVVHDLAERHPSGAAVLEDPAWRRFLMGPQEVRQELLRLQAHRKLQLETAGSVVSLTLPHESREAYVAALVE
jgi:hypothetical protein